MINQIIDIGNTRTKIAWFDNDEVIDVIYASSRQEIQLAIPKIKSDQVIISSVANKELTKFVISLVNEPLVLSDKTSIPIKVEYRTPETLGKDRLANAVAAYRLCSNRNSLIIDAGTCLKFDFINSENKYLGGIISPGLEMRFKSLNTFTDNLPLINAVDSDAVSMGVDTLTSIHAGCFKAMDREIRATIEDFKANYDDLIILVTGGDMEVLQKMGFSQKNSIFADRWLTLKGLNEILKYNVDA